MSLYSFSPLPKLRVKLWLLEPLLCPAKTCYFLSYTCRTGSEPTCSFVLKVGGKKDFGQSVLPGPFLYSNCWIYSNLTESFRNVPYHPFVFCKNLIYRLKYKYFSFIIGSISIVNSSHLLNDTFLHGMYCLMTRWLEEIYSVYTEEKIPRLMTENVLRYSINEYVQDFTTPVKWNIFSICFVVLLQVNLLLRSKYLHNT